jgi:hypothetical protein
MRPIGIFDRGGLLNHGAERNGLLRFAECIRRTCKDFKPLIQAGQNVWLRMLSGDVARDAVYGRGATLRALDSIIFKQTDSETGERVGSVRYVVPVRLVLLWEEAR